MNVKRFFAMCPPLLAALALHVPAQAQYSWIDEHGTRVFADRPPPPGTPPARILQAPHGTAAAMPSAPPAQAAAPESAQPAPPTLADRDAAFRKRLAQQQADERRAAEETRRKADMAEQCAAARRTEAYLKSGRRLTDLDDQGDRVVVTDEDKARRLAQAKRVLADCPSR